MNVVLYLRYSSASHQTEQSIEGQTRVCENFCLQNNYKIIDTYIDRARTASKNPEQRKNFQRLMKDCERGKFSGVVVYALDRFARNRYDSAVYKAKLKKFGVKLISATENISEAPEGIILESVLEGMAEFYSKELSRKVQRGMHESALKANSCGGSISLGYKIENKKFVIDPATAPVVQEAFKLYAAGKSVAEICRTFNEKGYRTAKGGDFNKNSFHQLFRNRRYIGEYHYTDVVIPNGIPPIIDIKTFEAVQMRLKHNADAPGRGKAIIEYYLSQKLFCGHCGGLMTGSASTSHTGEKYFYYVCSTRRNHKACNKENVRKDLIERAVAEDVKNMLTPEVIDEIAETAMQAQEIEIKKDTRIPALKQKISECEKSVKHLLSLVEKGAQSKMLASRITELEKEMRGYKSQLKTIEQTTLHLTKDHIVFWLSSFVDGDINDEEFQKRLITYFVEKVWIWDIPDGYKITIAGNLIGKPLSKDLTLKTLKKSTENDGAYFDCDGAPQKDNTHPTLLWVEKILIMSKIHSN